MLDAYTLGDLFFTLFLIATCIVCFIAGRIEGASGFAIMLIEHDVIDQNDLEKLHKKLSQDDE